MPIDRKPFIPVFFRLHPDYLPDNDNLNANFERIANAMGIKEVLGTICTEGSTHYGASDSTHCRLTLATASSLVGDKLLVADLDGDRIWRVIATYADEIEFTDSELVAGSSGLNDYNTLRPDIAILNLRKIQFDKNDIALGSGASCLHGDDLRMSAATATTVKDAIDAVVTDLAAHEADLANPHQVTFAQLAPGDLAVDLTIKKATPAVILEGTEGSGVKIRIVENAGNYFLQEFVGAAWVTKLPLKEASIDHGSIAGLADDDHTIYLKADGTRVMTGALDLHENQLKGFLVEQLAAPPAGTLGRFYWNTTDSKLYFFNGATWVSVTLV